MKYFLLSVLFLLGIVLCGCGKGSGNGAVFNPVGDYTITYVSGAYIAVSGPSSANGGENIMVTVNNSKPASFPISPSECVIVTNLSTNVIITMVAVARGNSVVSFAMPASDVKVEGGS